MRLCLDEIYGQCAEYGDCLVWQRCLANGRPCMTTYDNGRKQSVNVRRFVFEQERGQIGDGLWVVMGCNERGCLNAKHMQLMTRKEVAAKSASEGKFSTPQRRAAITAGKRKVSKLTIEIARQIRACETSVEAAEKFGIHPSMASRIRRGDAWRETSGASVFSWRP